MSISNPRCLYCHGAVDYKASWSSLLLPGGNVQLCEECRKRLSKLEGNLCLKCSRILQQEYEQEGCCHDCFRWEKDAEWSGVLSKNLSAFQYNDFMKEIISRFKFRGDYVIGKAFGNELRSCLDAFEYDLLIPVPLSPERLYERGFNQAEALIDAADLQWTQALERIHGEKQSKKSRNERIHLSQVFKCLEGSAVSVKDKRIVLVDDIYTTGSTLRHAAKVLLERGAKTISSVTLAR